MTTTTTRASQLDAIGLLARVLGDTPRLPEAACRGHSTLFDAPEPHEDADTVSARQRAARALCATCPAQSACAEWVQSAPPDRPSGILAGQLHVWKHWRPRDPDSRPGDTTSVLSTSHDVP